MEPKRPHFCVLLSLVRLISLSGADCDASSRLQVWTMRLVMYLVLEVVLVSCLIHPQTMHSDLSL